MIEIHARTAEETALLAADDPLVKQGLHITRIFKKYGLALFERSSVHQGHKRAKRALFLKCGAKPRDVRGIRDLRQTARNAAVNIRFYRVGNDEIGLYLAKKPSVS